MYSSRMALSAKAKKIQSKGHVHGMSMQAKQTASQLACLPGVKNSRGHGLIGWRGKLIDQGWLLLYCWTGWF